MIMKHLDKKEQFTPVQDYPEYNLNTIVPTPYDVLDEFYKLYTKTISKSFETSSSTEEALIIAFSG